MALLVLDTQQIVMVGLISRLFHQAGVGNWSAAAVVNAMAESQLRPTARAGRPEDSLGLFQLNSRGAGAGLGELRADPEVNTARIIQELIARGGREAKPATEGEAVMWFAHHVERCAACGHQAGDGELLRRLQLTDKLFGEGASEERFGRIPPLRRVLG